MKKVILATALLISTAFSGVVSTTYKHLSEQGYTDHDIVKHLIEFHYLTASEQDMMNALEEVGVPTKDCISIVEKKRTAEKKASKK